MSRTRTGYTTTNFSCPLVGRTVHIHQAYKIVLDQKEEESARVVTKTDCSNQNTCPIVTHHSTSASFDWSKCAFVKSQNAHS